MHVVFAPAFNSKRMHPLVSSAEAPLRQVITVKSFAAAQGMFTAIFSWINMNNICQRTAHQIRGNVNVLHPNSVCAAGQEISKAWTSIFFCFQPLFHHLKGAKGSYLFLIRLNRPISQPSAAALSFALIYSWLVWSALLLWPLLLSEKKGGKKWLLAPCSSTYVTVWLKLQPSVKIAKAASYWWDQSAHWSLFLVVDVSVPLGFCDSNQKLHSGTKGHSK